MKIFKFKHDNTNYTIVCEFHNTRNGFKHTADLFEEDNNIADTKMCYINRTWECFEYESVIYKVLEKAKFTPLDRNEIVKGLR